jgi:hypothetical protein
MKRFSKSTKISSFMKIRQMGDELFHADGRTGGQTDRHDKANSRFLQFCERAYKHANQGVIMSNSNLEKLPENTD